MIECAEKIVGAPQGPCAQSCVQAPFQGGPSPCMLLWAHQSHPNRCPGHRTARHGPGRCQWSIRRRFLGLDALLLAQVAQNDSVGSRPASLANRSGWPGIVSPCRWMRQLQA